MSSAPNYPIGSVDRTLRLLLHVSEHRTVRLSAAASALGVSQSTAHRMLDMLRHYGFVEQNRATKEYRVGPALVDIGLAAVQALDVRRETAPFLAELSGELRETVHLVDVRGATCVFLDAHEPPTRLVRSVSRVGTGLPAHTTSGGKALLAQLSTADLHALYPDEQLPALTPDTITRRAALERELDVIRDQGFAVNRGESEPEIGGVAVPLLDRLGQPRGALVVTAPRERLTDQDVPRFAAAAQAAATRWQATVPGSLRDA